MTESNTEIDLIELYQKALVFLFKKFLTFTIFIIIGLLLGTAYYLKKSNQIKTDYLAETNNISKELVYSLTDKIAFDLKKGNKENLKKELKLDDTVINEINKLEVDTTGEILTISITCNSEESLFPFTEALLKYYNNQPYILKAQTIKLEKKQDLISKIDEEINTINLFQNQFLNGNKEGNVTINQLNGLHSEKLRLYQMKQKCEDDLRQKNAITLINKGDNIIKQDISLIKTLAISVITSIFMALLFFFVQFSIELKNKAKFE